jgi:hypothetical protein
MAITDLKRITISVLESGILDTTVSVDTGQLGNDSVALRILLHSGHEGKNHQLKILTPIGYMMTPVLTEYDDRGAYVEIILKDDFFGRNSYYFINYINEDVESSNLLRLEVVDYVRPKGVNGVLKLEADNVSSASLKIVELLLGVKNIYVEADTGMFHFMQADGTELVLDLEVESILDPDNPPYWDEVEEELVITFMDGSVVKIPMPFENYLAGVIVDGVTLTPDGDRKVTIPAVDVTPGSESDGLISHEEQARLNAIEDGAEVNIIEGVIVDGVTLTPDGDRKVTIPVADDTGGSETDGLFTHEEKAKLAGVAESANNYSLPQADDTAIGGIKALEKTTEDTPVAIDTATGYLYVSIDGGEFLV